MQNRHVLEWDPVGSTCRRQLHNRPYRVGNKVGIPLQLIATIVPYRSYWRIFENCECAAESCSSLALSHFAIVESLALRHPPPNQPQGASPLMPRSQVSQRLKVSNFRYLSYRLGSQCNLRKLFQLSRICGLSADMPIGLRTLIGSLAAIRMEDGIQSRTLKKIHSSPIHVNPLFSPQRPLDHEKI